MENVYNTPSIYSGSDVQTFFANESWQRWVKPRGKCMVSIYAISAGGSGGGGVTPSGTANGGAGGGSGVVATAMIPAMALPDTLFISVPFGGKGGAVNTPGSASNNLYISIGTPSTSNNFTGLNMTSGTSGGSTAGAGGDKGFSNGIFWSAWGSLFNAFSGVGGSVGGVTGTSIAWNNSMFGMPMTGGAGGGGRLATNAGGSITGLGIVPTIAGGVNNANGGNGFTSLPGSRYGFFSTGGSGGSGTGTTGVAGAGGKGGIGSGGGGGGAANTGGTSGIGGNGGDGLVIITSW